MHICRQANTNKDILGLDILGLMLILLCVCMSVSLWDQETITGGCASKLHSSTTLSPSSVYMRRWRTLTWGPSVNKHHYMSVMVACFKICQTYLEWWQAVNTHKNKVVNIAGARDSTTRGIVTWILFVYSQNTATTFWVEYLSVLLLLLIRCRFHSSGLLLDVTQASGSGSGAKPGTLQSIA